MSKEKKEIPLIHSKNERPQRYGAIIRQQFRKNRMAVWSFRFLLFLIFIAFFGKFIANDKPIYCQIDGQSYFPVFKEIAVDLGFSQISANINWKKQPYKNSLRPFILYTYDTKDLENTYASPFSKQGILSLRSRHWFGTDKLGRDIAAGLINGTRTALLTGIIAMSIATFIGVFFGAIAGYFHDDKLKVSFVRLFLNIIGLVLGAFYGFMARTYAISEGSFREIMLGFGIFLFVLYLANLLAWLLEKIPFLNKKFKFPADILIMRLIEIMNSIPALLLLLSVVAIIDSPSILNIMIIIGLIRWTGIARFVRAELLRIRQLEYIQAAKALGFSEWRIILKHALPNAVGPVLISIAFGIAGAILIEATLSFLGIGVDANMVTWGSMLHDARSAPIYIWWLALFPGLAIFASVTIFNLIGEGLTDAIDAKQQN